MQKRDYQVKSTYMDLRSQLRSLLNFWIIGGAFAIACLLLIITLGLLVWTRPVPAPASMGTAVLYIIHAPTDIPPSKSTPLVTPSLPGMAPLPGQIAIGMNVQVTGTSGEGLRLRSAPGLENQILKLGAEGELFRVSEGPQAADGYTWWYLFSLEDETRRGWAVADYIKPIEIQ